MRILFHVTTAFVLLCLLTSCKGLHSSMGNVPVSFYGKVVDQDSNSLSGVKISASVRHWFQPDILAFAYGAKFIRITEETDQHGRFKFSGVSGDTLGIEGVYKDG